MIKLKYRGNDFKFKELEITPTIFPDGSSQIWGLKIFNEGENEILRYTDCEIIWHFANDSELLYVAQLKDLLDSYGHKSSLIMPYLPYARQDKEITNSTTFALKSFTKLLNSIGFGNIKAFDIHNTEFVPSFIKNMVPYNILSLTEELKPDFIFFPDHGAYSRYSTMFEDMGMEHFLFNKLPHIIGCKSRDQKNGNITKYEISPSQLKDEDPFDIEGKNCLVVDDLVDGGATFIKCYDLLKSLNVKDIQLYVSHVVQQSSLNRLTEHGYSAVHYYESLAK